MKKILILANNDVGLYKFRKELIEELINQGHKIIISLPYGKWVDPLIMMGCEFVDTTIDRRGINPIKDLKLLLNYNRMIKKIKPDLILTYTIKPNIYGGLISRFQKVGYIANITGLGSALQSDGLLKKIIIALYKISMGKADFVLFENKGNKQIFLDNNIIKDEIGICMNGAGVNLDEYSFTPMPINKPIRFLFIGRIMEEKGVNELFKVAEQIKKQYSDVEFDIVGPFEDAFQNIVEKLVKNGVINYYGYQDDVKPFIANCHCIVLPSYHEGMANTLLEAAAMGRPIITTNIYGCKEAMHLNGFFCQKANVESLFECIDKVINMNDADLNRMSLASRKHMERKFDKKDIVNRTLTMINKTEE